jgi:hypothetical protein
MLSRASIAPSEVDDALTVMVRALQVEGLM